MEDDEDTVLGDQISRSCVTERAVLTTFLKKNTSIEDLGYFRNSAAAGDPQLAKYVFILGVNGFGKTRHAHPLGPFLVFRGDGPTGSEGLRIAMNPIERDGDDHE